MGFTRGLGLEEFRADERTVLATLHSIMVVGEALNQITAGFQSRYPHIPWREATGMRNRLIHAYDDVDYRRVLETARTNLPQLAFQLEAIIQKEGGL